MNATLYALSTAPKLDARDEVKHTVVHSGQSEIQEPFQYGYFYLYAGSNVSVSACTNDNTYLLFILKGKDTYTLWQNGKEGPSVVAHRCKVEKLCNGYSDQQSSTCDPCERPMEIPAADDWYFMALSATANVTLHLQRYEYKVENSAILSSCIAGGSKPQSCTVAKTLDASTYLLVIGLGESIAIVEATTSCASDSSQLQTYTILVALFVAVTALLLCMVIVCSILISICAYVNWRQKRGPNDGIKDKRTRC